MSEQEKGFGQSEGAATAVLQEAKALSAKDPQNFSNLSQLLDDKEMVYSQEAQAIWTGILAAITDQEILVSDLPNREIQLATEVSQLIHKAQQAKAQQQSSSSPNGSLNEKIDSLAERFVNLVVDHGENDSKEVARRSAIAIVKGMQAATTGEPVVRNGEAEIDFELAREIEELTKMALILS
jgi:hypothetical protein